MGTEAWCVCFTLPCGFPSCRGSGWDPGGAAWLGPLPPLGLFTLGCQQQYLFGEMPPFGISYFLFGKRAQGLSRVKKAKRGEAAHNSCPFASD